MKSKNLAKILIVAGSILMLLVGARIVFAGFGVSPPKVVNHHLLPGSRFEQTIFLVQSKPDKELSAKIELDAPDIKNWVSIDRGWEFDIPTGIQQFPLKIIINVPPDAPFRTYSGEMWIKTSPKERGEGMVTIALGAIVSFELEVSPEKVYGFVLRGVSIEDTEEGKPIKVGITLENVGNIKDRPTKIHLDVYDKYHDKLLWSGDATDLGFIEPFETKTVEGKFQAGLAIDQYWAEIKAYKDDNVLTEEKRSFRIIERKSFVYKASKKWYTWVIVIAVIIIVLLIIFAKQIKTALKIWRIKRREKKKARLEEKLRKLQE